MGKEQVAIDRLQEASRISRTFKKKPLIVTTSGGKDSSVCVELALRAGIEFELMHDHTTADAPETVRFLRSEFKRLEGRGFPSARIIINYPKHRGAPCSMWSLIPQNLMPPTSSMRYCCSILKGSGGRDRVIATGVRRAESSTRANARYICEAPRKSAKKRYILPYDNDDRRWISESIPLKLTMVFNPIVDWTDRDVWDFLEDAKIPVNPLYGCGASCVDCIGCPMSGAEERQKDFLRWPKYKNLYIQAFDRMLDERRKRGMHCESWQTGEDVFRWWMEDGPSD